MQIKSIKNKTKKGFTIIELIVVLAVIAILVFIGSLAYKGYTKHATFVRLCHDARILTDASERYFINNGDYPRLADTPYTAAQVNSFTKQVYNYKGSAVTLEESGNYYDVDFNKLKKYCRVNEDYKNFILQNPVGEVYVVDPNREATGITPTAPTINVNLITNPPIYNITYPNGITPQETDYRLDGGTISTTAPTTVLSDGTHTIEVRYKYNNELSNWASVDFTVLTGAKQICTGAGVTFVITADNSLWGCGYNIHGQVGDGTTVDKHSFVKIMDNVAMVSNNGLTTGVVKTDGSLWMWGADQYAQFGDGVTAGSKTPKKIMDGVKSVECADTYTLIIKSDGTLWGSGDNNDGELGTGYRNYTDGFVYIMSDVQSMSTGNHDSAVIKTDGSLWTFGSGNYGQIGNGSTDTYQLVPTKIMDDVQSITIQDMYAVALKKDNTLWTWGNNQYGQLCTGDKYNRTKPVQVASNIKFADIGYSTTFFIKSDNTLWGCGYNGYGQLGNGSTTDSVTPIKIMDNVEKISAFYDSIATKSDGTIMIWGSNMHGEMGDGTTTDKYTPVEFTLPR